MANTTNSKISNLIESQVPFFVRNDHGNFVKFLEHYYKFLEQEDNPVAVAKNLINNQNIDLTEDEYAERLYKIFMKYIPKDIKADKKLILKHIKDFYRAKGTEKSIRFLMRLIGNTENVDFYYPQKDVLRASDGKWFIQRSLRIDDIRIEGVPSPLLEELQKFIGTAIVGTTTGTTAIVESVDRFYEENSLINELILSNINGKFKDSEVVEGQYEENGVIKKITAVVYNFVIDKINILSPGLGYSEGDPVIITSNTGAGACVFVSSVTAGEVTGVLIEDGGVGFRVGDQVTFDGPLSRGIPATANIRSVDLTEKFHPNRYLIDDSLILSEANTAIDNPSASEYESFAYQNLATQFIYTAPNTTNLYAIVSPSTTLVLNRIADRANVSFSNNSAVIINNESSIIETSSNLSTNTINIFPGFTGNIFSSNLIFYTARVSTNLIANTASGSETNTIELQTKVLTPNVSNLKIASLGFSNAAFLTHWAGNSNVFFTTGYTLNVNNRTVLITELNANSTLIRTSPALFGTLTDNSVVVFEVSYPSVQIGNSNVSLMSGNTITVNGVNVYITSSSPTSNTITVYPSVPGGLANISISTFSNPRISNTFVQSAYANNIRLNEYPANSNVYFTIHDKLVIDGETVDVKGISPTSNVIQVSPGIVKANANVSNITVIRPPYSESSNLTFSTGSGNSVSTITLSDIKQHSNVYFETYDSLNVNGIVVLVTSSNTITNTINVSPGLPGNLSMNSFVVIKKANANTTIANSLIYLNFSNTGPATEIRITNPGGYLRVPSARIIANTKIFSRGILGRMRILSGGTGYQIGDDIEFINVPGGFGFGAAANVTNVAANGMITEVKFVEVPGQLIGGSGYDQFLLPRANVITTTGSGANIAVTNILGSGEILRANTDTLGAIRSVFIASRGRGYEDANIDLTKSGNGRARANVSVIAGDIFGVFAYPGRYLNDDGHISSYNFLQDRDYYQTFSYVIKTPLSTKEYRQAVQDLVHPAGMRMFGEYMVLDEPANTTCPCNVSTTLKTIIVPRTYEKTGNTINISYGSHGFEVGNTVFLEFTSNNAGNVENGIYSVRSTSTDYFEVLQKGPIKTITINNAGRGYNANSYLIITGDGVGANATYTINANGSIVSVNVRNFGIEYSSNPVVTANGSNSVPATFAVTIMFANNTSGNVEVGRIVS
jgi:hypothetical protein